uniref:Uncharacterized protein n=1 Tax=Sphaerodactylus townsendi TaxID=933632 RepID=A0ACB8ESE5_9SAUR
MPKLCCRHPRAAAGERRNLIHCCINAPRTDWRTDGFQLLLAHQQASNDKEKITHEAQSLTPVIRELFLAAYIILVTSLRYHLFIWSVFSPKLLYEGVHVIITVAVCMFFMAMDQNRSRQGPV